MAKSSWVKCFLPLNFRSRTVIKGKSTLSVLLRSHLLLWLEWGELNDWRSLVGFPYIHVIHIFTMHPTWAVFWITEPPSRFFSFNHQLAIVVPFEKSKFSRHQLPQNLEDSATHAVIDLPVKDGSRTVSRRGASPYRDGISVIAPAGRFLACPYPFCHPPFVFILLSWKVLPLIGSVWMQRPPSKYRQRASRVLPHGTRRREGRAIMPTVLLLRTLHEYWYGYTHAVSMRYSH